eukprot:gnl/TRDRNA2_/TRDRNA2_78103_c0_seq2.p1 gnl/TRDRNA2_/TRDRNA2_78103_c0~~gnl/TRDRNA2_/TRDRNA2_78103_c0_seq2.p1  ORF type:complete len:167 (-),score=35.28 gnl/TRDRNA2_/TRDRNA2_78103_c0_seq2:32-532(-)
MHELNVQNLANAAWTFAALDHANAKLFEAQELSHMAWACAKEGKLDAKLSEALARTSEWRLHEFKVQNLAFSSWAFASASQTHAKLFRALAKMIQRRTCEFTVQSVADVAWAFAKVCHENPLEALAKAAEWRAGKLKPQELVNKWARSTRRLSPMRHGHPWRRSVR